MRWNRGSTIAVTLAAITIATILGASAVAQDGAELAFRGARGYTVRIRTQVETPFIEDERGSWEGAGFLVDARRGWILTNAHVAGRSPSDIQVGFADGEYMPARKVYVDSFTDVAVLEIESGTEGRLAAPITGESIPAVGEAIGVFGHPLGFPFTGTRGIVSGLTDQDGPDLIQIDATVNGGNSGGPVIRLRDGRIIGIATSGVGGDRSDKVNFATPMKDVCRILDLLRRQVPPEPPQLPFNLLKDEDDCHTMQVGSTNDPQRWPFEPDDRILFVTDERPKTLGDLVTAFRGREGSVPVVVERGARKVTLQVRPERQPSILARRGLSVDGALIAPLILEDELVGGSQHLIVHSVEDGSDAEALMVGEGDYLLSVDGRRYQDLDSLIVHVRHERREGPLRIVFGRYSQSHSRMLDHHLRMLPAEDIRDIGPAPVAPTAAAQ